MYKMTTVNDLIEKLSNPFWFSKCKTMSVIPDTEGAINILWALQGHVNDLRLWNEAYAYSRIEVDGSMLERTATVLSLEEFALYVDKHLKSGVRIAGFKPIVNGKLLLRGAKVGC